MYITVDKKILKLVHSVTVNSVMLMRNVTERTLCHLEYIIKNCNIFSLY